jgi:hypothetical protein
MNSGAVAANNDNIMPDHVLEVALDEERLHVRRHAEMINGGHEVRR